ncbi:helix-turn-helix transcriptional regulator [Leptolyngbya sp. FACHB-671]|uniref:AraC family transcriptional regulator n=1 Tax=Leptolyngbya sp. FACHB-671 TaxID=2692812 RepID=UPI0016878208|nr:AraC family transcriptional regulator [Leptolyngbya sp. FACHB-671]MBD2067059.1 helix-turn-helix transcriptional regulator [Leptolyngbya sp. FACHB-671]
MAGNLVSPLELGQRLNKPPVLSSRQLGWNGILVEQCQCSSPSSFEMELPAVSAHWLNLSLGRPTPLIQKRDDRLHESIVQKGDSIFVPAGQPSYWRQHEGDICCPLHICLKPELIEQVAEASEIDAQRINLVNCFGKQDLQLHHVAMLLLAELQSGGIMGRLYVESLTQVLVIHLLRHYSTVTQTITSGNRSLTNSQLQQAIDYIHTHLNRDLSLAELAGIVNISPTYFASLFKQAMGISPHQYVIQRRVQRAKVMLKKTDLAIADIALQVGFSSQSHLTQQFKRVTGMTPKQVR